MSATVIVLVSTASSSMPMQKCQRKIIDWLQIKKVVHQEVDGANEEFRDLRNKLWEVSGQRTYPQVYTDLNKVLKTGEAYTFVGDYDAIEYLMESETFDQTFSEAARE